MAWRRAHARGSPVPAPRQGACAPGRSAQADSRFRITRHHQFGHLIEYTNQDGYFLRTGHGVAAIKYVGRHSTDIECRRMALGRDDRILASAQDDRVAGVIRLKARLDPEPYQLIDVADVAAFLKIGPHDALGDLALQPKSARVQDQQVRAPRIGHEPDQLKAKINADGLAEYSE